MLFSMFRQPERLRRLLLFTRWVLRWILKFVQQDYRIVSVGLL